METAEDQFKKSLQSPDAYLVNPFNILAFGCGLSSQKGSFIDVQLYCKDVSQVEDEDTRTTSIMLLTHVLLT